MLNNHNHISMKIQIGMCVKETIINASMILCATVWELAVNSNNAKEKQELNMIYKTTWLDSSKTKFNLQKKELKQGKL